MGLFSAAESKVSVKNGNVKQHYKSKMKQPLLTCVLFISHELITDGLTFKKGIDEYCWLFIWTPSQI